MLPHVRHVRSGGFPNPGAETGLVSISKQIIPHSFIHSTLLPSYPHPFFPSYSPTLLSSLRDLLDDPFTILIRRSIAKRDSRRTLFMCVMSQKLHSLTKFHRGVSLTEFHQRYSILKRKRPLFRRADFTLVNSGDSRTIHRQ